MPGVVVKGAAVSEKTYVDSVTSIFSDLFPQGNRNSKASHRLNNQQSSDLHETVLWAHVVLNDAEDVLFSIVIGYSTGIQIWKVSEHGDATEQLSIRCGASSVFRKIPPPSEITAKYDKFASKRPIAAYTASQNGVKQSFKTLIYISFLSGEHIHSLSFTSSIQDLVATNEVIVATFYDRLAVFDNATLQHKFSVTSCFPSISNCVSLTSTWLAYCDRFLVPRLQSGGGVSNDGRESYAATIVKSASYGLNAGLNLLSQYTSGTKPTANNTNGSNHLNGTSSHGSPSDNSEYSSPLSSASSSPLLSHSSSFSLSGQRSSSGLKNINTNGGEVSTPRNGGVSCGGVACIPGVVTVVDLSRVPKPSKKCKHVVVGTNNEFGPSGMEEVLAHFPAYTGESIVTMEISNRGVIATAGESGRLFNVFRMHPHPWTSSQCAVHHLYALRRGETVAKISHISLSADLRWVSGCSSKGTVHLFPINCYGGQPSPRTHCDTKVANKEDKFYCSAGLDDVRPAMISVAQQTMAHLSSSPSSPSFESQKLMSVGSVGSSSAGCAARSSSFRAVLNGTVTHPRIPPYPQPIQLDPSAQIKAPYSNSGVPVGCIPAGLNLNELTVKSVFAPPCFNLDAFQLEFNSNIGNDWAPSIGNFEISPPDLRIDRSSSIGGGSQYGFSLYTFFGMSPSVLLETSVRVGRDVSNRDQIEVSHSPSAQWNLTRCTHWKEVKPVGWSNSASNTLNGHEDRKNRSKSTAVSNQDHSPLYDTQASSDTLTDLLNPSDLSSSRTSNTITTTTSSNEFLNPDEDKKQQSNNKSRTESCNLETKCAQYNFWMAQVEMNTHASPHRRLWMGPQFTFKTIMDKRKQEAARGSCMDPNESHNSDHNGEQPANLEVTHSFVGDTCMSASTTVEAERVDNETDVPTGCVDMFRALPFQSVDKMDLDVLRMSGFISPLVKSRQNITHLRTTAVSPTTPNSSPSWGASSPPDNPATIAVTQNSSSSPAGGAFISNQTKSKPVPIGGSLQAGRGGGASKLHRSDRYKSDSGDSISSTGSAGSSYPFYIEVGSGDFERYRNMLNVPPNHHQHIANAQLMSAGNSNHGNKTRPGLRSRQGSSASMDDVSSWGEDANLDDALNSLESDSNQQADDFHDAMDDMSEANARTRSRTESNAYQNFSSLPPQQHAVSSSSANHVRRRHNHKKPKDSSHNRHPNDWRNFGANMFFSRQNQRVGSGGLGVGGVNGDNGADDFFDDASSIEGMLAEAMAEHSPSKLTPSSDELGKASAMSPTNSNIDFCSPSHRTNKPNSPWNTSPPNSSICNKTPLLGGTVIATSPESSSCSCSSSPSNGTKGGNSRKDHDPTCRCYNNEGVASDDFVDTNTNDYSVYPMQQIPSDN